MQHTVRACASVVEFIRSEAEIVRPWWIEMHRKIMFVSSCLVKEL